jgi:hypothetical protein
MAAVVTPANQSMDTSNENNNNNNSTSITNSNAPAPISTRPELQQPQQQRNNNPSPAVKSEPQASPPSAKAVVEKDMDFLPFQGDSIMKQCNLCGKHRLVPQLAENTITAQSSFQCSDNIHNPAENNCSAPEQIIESRMYAFPRVTDRVAAPHNFTLLGVQIFDDSTYQQFYAHPDWTKYETIALLDIIKREGIDQRLEQLVTADSVLKVRQNKESCETRLLQLLSLAAIYQQHVRALSFHYNPYNHPVEPSEPLSPNSKQAWLAQQAAAQENQINSHSKAKKFNGADQLVNKPKNAGKFDEVSRRNIVKSETGRPTRNSARVASQRTKTFAYHEASESEDFMASDSADAEEDKIVPQQEVVVEPEEPVWRIEKILAERRRRVKEGDEEKPEPEEVIEQQIIESTIKSVDEHRTIRFKHQEDENAVKNENNAQSSVAVKSEVEEESKDVAMSDHPAAGADVAVKSEVTPEVKEGIKPAEDPSAKYLDLTEYLIKVEGQSYLHCEWHSETSLFEKFGQRHGKDRIMRWNGNKRKIEQENLDLYGGEPFDPRYTNVDRVVSAKIVEVEDEPGQPPLKEEERRVEMFLVKWVGLSYVHATWETEEDVDDPGKIAEFRRFNRQTQKDQSVTYTAEEFMLRKASWYKESPVYKNKNRLRDYQVLGINWLINAWYEDRNCILADESKNRIIAIIYFSTLRSFLTEQFVCDDFVFVSGFGQNNSSDCFL